jgi:hypothetical protein
MNAPIKFYYTNARMNKKTALLAGPFPDVETASKLIDLLGPAFIEADPDAKGATFGVMEVNAYAGKGIFNDALPAMGIFPLVFQELK